MSVRAIFHSLLAVATGALLVTTTGAAQEGAQGKGGGGGGKPGGGADHKARQARPIQLGVSGGNSGDLANGFCCSGTLGALVTDGTTQFILSNTHVFAGDSVPGGNSKIAAVGDDINQSGLIDVGCQYIAGDIVADLSQWAPLGNSDHVDAALAAVKPGQVRTDGAVLEIGTLSSSTALPFVNQSVKKSGRTTGLTKSKISALNATVLVGYTDECAGGNVTVSYTGQIIIGNRGSRFLDGGDSGSLMVEDVATNPRAVGLLYAGSSSVAIANPINDVLRYFNVTMVGADAGAASGSTADENGPASAKGLARAIAVQGRHGRELLNVPGAVGHAVGAGNSPLIKILVREITPGAQASAPRQLEGVPVVLEEVGDIKGMPFCSKRK